MLLSPDELEKIEREFPTGLSAKKIIEIFQPKGVRLSEATFRKYVQTGLLPQSKRVGRKGKHQGSLGLYPVESVRRINAIKKMMAEGLTLEDIKSSFVVFKNQVDLADRSLFQVLSGLHQELKTSGFSAAEKKKFLAEVTSLEQQAIALVSGLERLGSRLKVKSEAGVVRSAALQ